MKRLILPILILLGVLASCHVVHAQSNVNRLFRPCPATTTKALVEIQRDGDINFAPCSGREVQINGVATSNTITFTGSSRTNYFPYFTTNTNLGKSPFSWNGTTYTWFDTALTSTFAMSFKPSSSNGRLLVGDPGNPSIGGLDILQGSDSSLFSASALSVGATNGLTLTGGSGVTLQSSNTQILIDSGSNVTRIGDAGNNFNTTSFSVEDTNKYFTCNGAAFVLNNSCAGTSALDGSGILDLSGNGCYITAASAGSVKLFALANGGSLSGSLYQFGDEIRSSAGAGDSAKEINWWIVAVP